MKKIILLVGSILLVACAAQQVQPGAANVMVTTNPPPSNCKHLGEVVGNQGNFFTGNFTSNANLEQGSMNDLKNKAAKMGGNYVQIITNRAGNTGQIGSSGRTFMQTNVTSAGNVFKCPSVVNEE